MSEQTIPNRNSKARLRLRRFRVGALAVILVVAVGVLWLVLRDNGSSSNSNTASNVTVVSIAQIQALANSVGHPVFWVGPKAGYTYELTRTSNGSIFIRYLPPGAKVGTKTPYLTVATYPFPGALAAIQAVVKQKGSTAIPVANNGLAEASSKAPTSVHAAYVGVDYQVEVFDPTPGVAKSVVTSGKLASFGRLASGSSKSKASAVSPAGLRTLARSLGHPIWWVGRKSGYTYELSRTSTGLIYLRYLPAGTPVGAPGEYLTVGTYPYPGAFAAIQALGKQPKAETIKLTHGGLAVVDKDQPNNIHLAYPGSDYQVEVFDPSAADARQLVSSGQVKSIG